MEKVILITGSTDGIGKLAAQNLANGGYQMLLHGRNAAKLERTITEIRATTGNKNIRGVTADLANFDEVTKLIAQLKSELPLIDVLINNAGIFHSKTLQNGENLDIRFAVNYFAPYLLTNGLIPQLQKSAAPKVINLSSAAQATISFGALVGQETINTNEAYAQSKLAITMWSFYLAQKYAFLNVIAVNPGSLLNTKMVQEAFGQFWASADKGADILYDLATLEVFANSSGKYFDNDKGIFSKAHHDAYNDDIIQQLIIETDKILNL